MDSKSRLEAPLVDPETPLTGNKVYSLLELGSSHCLAIWHSFGSNEGGGPF